MSLLVRCVIVPIMKTAIPSFDREQQLWAQGYCSIAGIDEAGRGALAGPVVAAAVIAPRAGAAMGVWAAVRDSKQLSANARTALAPEIRMAATAWGLGCIDAALIDQIGIAAATRQAMAQAVAALQPAPDYLLLDWVRLPMVNIAQESHVKADAHIASVAAASILAKVHRDDVMTALAQEHPSYGFAEHKGYGTAAHLATLERYGPCTQHRRSFAPLATQLTLFSVHTA